MCEFISCNTAVHLSVKCSSKNIIHHRIPPIIYMYHLVVYACRPDLDSWTHPLFWKLKQSSHLLVNLLFGYSKWKPIFCLLFQSKRFRAGISNMTDILTFHVWFCFSRALKRKPFPKFVSHLMSHGELHRRVAEVGLPFQGDRKVCKGGLWSCFYSAICYSLQ